jgi:hypothetical protein
MARNVQANDDNLMGNQFINNIRKNRDVEHDDHYKKNVSMSQINPNYIYNNHNNAYNYNENVKLSNG